MVVQIIRDLNKHNVPISALARDDDSTGYKKIEMFLILFFHDLPLSGTPKAKQEDPRIV